MKASSALRLGIVIVLFVVVQGWLLTTMFVAPHVFHSSDAYLMGSTIDVHAPVAGTLQNVAVQEGQSVVEGQILFIISRTFIDPQTQRSIVETVPVYAQQVGVVTHIVTTRGTFVLAEQQLATIVDNSGNSLYVTAHLAVAPADVAKIRALGPATVQADFLYGGAPIDAMISSVDPLYDPQNRLLGVRLQLLHYPDGIAGLPLGLPVTVTVTANRSADDNAVIAFLNWVFPHANSQTN